MGFNKGISSNINISSGNNNPPSLPTISKEPYQVGRVRDIILDANYPEIEQYGGLNGIGTIKFGLINDPSIGEGVAKPLYPQNSSYPLVNELVLIFKLPNNNIGRTNSSTSSYYINMISLWNHPHHNAYPNPKKGDLLPPQQNKDYQETEAGSVRRVTDSSTEINLNSPSNPYQDTFIERTNIHPLLPFPGDIITQGRWGNSIRFGSTAKPINLPSSNTWSSTGINGDPITIIRNGQPIESSDEGWVPITENINTDLSSIWQTSTQKIPINVANENYNPYNTPPEVPSQYTNPQVIINSDRLVFNAKTDSILLSGEKSIFLGSNSSINLNAGKNIVIECSDIKLGDKNATESLIKGDMFLMYLQTVIKQLDVLCTSLASSIVYPSSPIGPNIPAPNAPVNAAASSLKGVISTFNSKLEDYKSKVSKTR